MSGPKVIRVVTREELVARAQAQLARLDAVAAEWRKVAERTGVASGALSELQQRRKDLESRIDHNQFAELQRDAESEISFLRSDIDNRVERAIEAAVEARYRRRQEMTTARSLLDELRKVGTKMPDDVAKQLTLLSTGADARAGVINEAFELLSASQLNRDVSDRQANLARELGKDERRTTYSEWLAGLQISPVDDLSQRIDHHLAELRERDGLEASASFEASAEVARNESSPARRRMLCDSLVIKLSAAVEASRKRERQQSRLNELAAELATVRTAASQVLQKELASALAARMTNAVESLAARARSLIDDNVAANAAEQRRRVILQGLAKLGYEVTEGMSTAWVRDGRIVTRKAVNPQFGMEIGGGPEGGRLQVRAVALEPYRRDATQEREVEAAWCSDIDRFQEFMHANGGQISIERATSIGVVPLKAVTESEVERAVDTAAIHTRTIRS